MGEAGRWRSAAWEGVSVAALVAATAWASRPWIWSPNLVFGEKDTLFSLVVLDHLQKALTGPLDFKDAPLGWPIPHGSIQADWMMGQALLGLPFHLAGVDALSLHKILVFLAWLTTAWSFHRLARALLGPGPHTVVAGIIAGLNPTMGLHANHLNLVFYPLLGLGSLLLGAGLVQARKGWAFLGGLSLVLGAQFGLYVGTHHLLVAPLVVAGALLAGHRDWRTLGAAALGFLAGALTLGPAADMYLGFASRYGTWFDLATLKAESWDPASSFGLLQGVPLHEALARFRGHAPDVGFKDAFHPGFLATLLAVAGLALGRSHARPHRWAWWVAGAVLVLSLGLALGPVPSWNGRYMGVWGPYTLLTHLPGTLGLRGPGRWLQVAHMAMALLAALGVRSTLGALPRAGPWLAALLPVALALETLRTPVLDRAHLEPGPVYQELATRSPGAVFDVLPHEGLPCGCSEASRMMATLRTGRPLAGGMGYARGMKAMEELNHQGQRWPEPEAIALFRMAAIPYRVEHAPLITTPPAGADCVEVGGDRLCQVPGPVLTRFYTPEDVTTTPSGPVIGLRFPEPLKKDGVRITLQDGSTWEAPQLPVRALDVVRYGRDPKYSEVYFPPQDEPPQASVPGGVPLYARQPE